MRCFHLAACAAAATALLLSGCGRSADPEPVEVLEIEEEPEVVETISEPEPVTVDIGDLKIGSDGVVRTSGGGTVQTNQLIVLKRQKGQSMVQVHRHLAELRRAGYHNISYHVDLEAKPE